MKTPSVSGILVKPTPIDHWSWMERRVRISQGTALSVDAKALNNEASEHAYNREPKVRLFITFGSRREKEVPHLF